MSRPVATTHRPIRTQVVTVGASSAATTNAFGSGIHVVRIVSDTACHYAIGKSPTATASDAYLPANEIEYLSISEGEKIAFIQDSAGGNAYATEVSQ